jgi:membrane protein DedA with SNARE-associated domain
MAEYTNVVLDLVRGQPNGAALIVFVLAFVTLAGVGTQKRGVSHWCMWATLAVASVACSAPLSAAEPQTLVASMRTFVDPVIDFVKNNQEWALPIVFLLAFGESLAFVSLILPATVILASIAGLLGGAQVDKVMAFWVWFAAGFGGALGYAVSYWIGWWFRDDIEKVWPLRNHPDAVSRARAFFKKWGALAVFFGHFFGPVRAVIPVIAGSLGLRQLTFQIANITSSFLWALGVLILPLYGIKWLSLL